MRRLPLLILAIFSLALTAAAQYPAEWRRYTSPDFLYDIQSGQNDGDMSETAFRNYLTDLARTNIARSVRMNISDRAEMSRQSTDGRTTMDYSSVTLFSTDVELSLVKTESAYDRTMKAGYEGFDRVDLESIVGEQTFQRTGMVSDEQIKQLGEMTGASYILVAEVAKVDDSHIFITAKILDVETARLEMTANVQTQTDPKDIEDGYRRLSAMLLGTEMPASSGTGAEDVQVADRANGWNDTVNELIAQQLEAKKARQEARQEKAAQRAAAKEEANAARRQQDQALDSYIMSIEESREVPEGIRPGMKYRQYRKLYKASDYVRMPGDRYSPVVGGLCSFLIPGLGHAVNGDFGRGLAFFGGTVAGYMAMGVGIGMLDSYDEGAGTAGSVLVTVGGAAVLGVAIWSIIDGVQHAKIKNMYLRDIVGISSLDISLNPYIASTAAPFSPDASPAFGLSLNVTF